jgi:hypothetical protein
MMTIEDKHMKSTIDMAREAGLLTWLNPPEDVIERFKAFEAIVRADAIAGEREACAKVCESIESDGYPTIEHQECAAAIRARGNT